VADALPLSIEQKIIVANLLGLNGRYLDIWNNFTILLADNTALDPNQKDYIFELFSAIQPALYNLRLMSFSSELGTAPSTSSGNVASFLAGINTGVNSFSNTIGTYPENQFPSEVPPGIADIFCSAAPHEANHIVDYFFIEGNTTLKNRKTQLIAQAGNDNLNYLRSTASAGFFVANPQEFIASIANEYFVDTKKTLDLALIRFNNGRSEPLNQFLYFANLYTANNGNFTRFYNTDANCNFSFQQVGIGRDANNRLNQICYDDVQYSFTLNAIGNVIAYNTAACSNCYITPNITGGDEACPLVVYSYTTPFVAGSTYQWIVTGGVILSGQGTNTINVQWYNNVEGMVQLIKGN